MTIHAEYQTPKGERMNAIDELRQYIDNRGEQLIANGNGMYRPDSDHEEAMDICLKHILDCSVLVVMLPCWEDSDGAKLERAVAIGCGIPVLEVSA